MTTQQPWITRERGAGSGTRRYWAGPAPRSLLPLLAGALLTVTSASLAQNPPLPPPSQAASALQQAVQQNPGLPDVIRQRLLQSGLTPEQVRARLQASGYPPNLLDAYLGGGVAPSAQPAGALELAAIRALGLPPAGPSLLAADTRVIPMRGRC